MNPNSRCRTNSFEEFKFQYVSGDIHIHIATQNTILTFSQSGTLLGNVNIEVSPNIWNRNTFRTTNLYALGVHRQFERQKLYNWICSTVKLELNWNWRAHNRSIFFNGFQLYMQLELFRSSYSDAKSCFC